MERSNMLCPSCRSVASAAPCGAVHFFSASARFEFARHACSSTAVGFGQCLPAWRPIMADSGGQARGGGDGQPDAPAGQDDVVQSFGKFDDCGKADCPHRMQSRHCHVDIRCSQSAGADHRGHSCGFTFHTRQAKRLSDGVWSGWVGQTGNAVAFAKKHRQRAQAAVDEQSGQGQGVR